MDAEIRILVRQWLRGNEDAKNYPDEGIFPLADRRGIDRNTDDWHYYVAGASAYRFDGLTCEVTSDTLEETQ